MCFTGGKRETWVTDLGKNCERFRSRIWEESNKVDGFFVKIVMTQVSDLGHK